MYEVDYSEGLFLGTSKKQCASEIEKRSERRGGAGMLWNDTK
jgi:hypothetical protein